MSRFAGRVVVVTGAAKGIGLRIVRAFASEGARVAALDIDGAGLEALTREREDVLALKSDVTAAAEVRQAVETVVARWGRVDVLVNIAGGFSVIRRTEDIPEAEWDAIFRLNVTSAFLASKAVLPIMREQRAGHILQVSSIGGLNAFPTVGMYHASKWGLEGFSQSLAAEVAEFGIKVTLIEPAGYATDWGGASAKRAASLQAYDGARARSITMRASTVSSCSAAREREQPTPSRCARTRSRRTATGAANRDPNRRASRCGSGCRRLRDRRAGPCDSIPSPNRAAPLARGRARSPCCAASS